MLVHVWLAFFKSLVQEHFRKNENVSDKITAMCGSLLELCLQNIYNM